MEYFVFHFEKFLLVFARIMGLFFTKLLQRHQIICTPGIGFGTAGEGYVRFSGFCGEETAKTAAKRMQGSPLFFSLV